MFFFFFGVFFDVNQSVRITVTHAQSEREQFVAAELCKLYIERLFQFQPFLFGFFLFWIFLHDFFLTHFACWNNKTHKFSACCPRCCSFSLVFHIFRFSVFSYFVFLLCLVFCVVFLSNVIIFICEILDFLFLFLSLPFVCVFFQYYTKGERGREGEGGGKQQRQQLSRKYAAYNTRTLKTH